MWLFKHKYFADGSLSRYKARLVINGTSQQIDVDYDETFSPIVKSATICTVFSFAASRHWPIHQLDVMNAFLHGTLSHTVSASRTPVDTDSKLGADGTPVFDPTLYRSLVGDLQYLNFIRPDLPYEVVRLLVVLLQIIVFSLLTIYCLSLSRGSTLCLALVPKPSTEGSPMQWLILIGCRIFFTSSTLRYIRLPLFIVIMSVRYIYLPVSCNTSARST
nr:ribonuclease H-like domain-containing protein [Tanacetum cinerariifolium]